MEVSEARRLRELEAENAKLKRLPLPSYRRERYAVSIVATYERSPSACQASSNSSIHSRSAAMLRSTVTALWW
jgi:hypothetical protein